MKITKKFLKSIGLKPKYLDFFGLEKWDKETLLFKIIIGKNPNANCAEMQWSITIIGRWRHMQGFVQSQEEVFQCLEACGINEKLN